MQTILLIILVAFIKSIADVIRVPACMQSSIFRKWIGKMWLDPEISDKLKYKLGWILEPFLSLFSDSWHTSNTIMLLCLFSLPFTSGLQAGWIESVAVYFAVYGITFNIFRKMWIFFGTKK